jgi:hypothetical protein
MGRRGLRRGGGLARRRRQRLGQRPADHLAIQEEQRQPGRPHGIRMAAGQLLEEGLDVRHRQFARVPLAVVEDVLQPPVGVLADRGLAGVQPA